ncbi:MAG: hypothetical protein NC452_20780 [Eubacterium sp.]|nr:hypothetical protein [Eubacterium sp.]
MDEYSELAASVIIQAVKDYRCFARKLNSRDPKISARHTKKVKEIKKFFLSDWYDTLAKISNFKFSGDEVLEILNHEKIGVVQQ